MKQREIKLRAFNSEDKEMYGNGVALQLLYQTSIGKPLPEKWTIIQYTEFNDMEGDEIYDGAIVNDDGDIKEIWIELGHTCIGRRGENGYDSFLTYGDTHTIKIIGHAYSNPELLNP